MFESLLYVLFISIVLVITLLAIRIIIVNPAKEAKIQEFLREKKYEEAIILLKKNIAKEPYNYKNLFQLAEIYWITNKLEQAVDIYNSLKDYISYNKDSSMYKKILYRLGEWKYQQKKFDDSFKLVESLLTVDKNNSLYLELMGDILSAQKNNVQALEYYHQTIAIKKNHTKVLWKIGDIYFLQKKFDKAYSVYSHIIELEPKNALIWFRVGEISVKQKDYDKAIKFYQKSETLGNPDMAFNSLYELVAIFEKQDNNQQKIQALERTRLIIKENPYLLLDKKKVVTIYYELGEHYLKNNHIDLAIIEWEKIINIIPDYLDVQEKMDNYSSLQLNDFFKDILTNSDENLINIICNFVKNLGYTIDSYQAYSSESVDISVSESSGKWRDIRRRKTVFSFWCSTNTLPIDIAIRLTKYQKIYGISQTLLISAGSILSEARMTLRDKSIDIYEKNNIQELINARKESIANDKK